LLTLAGCSNVRSLRNAPPAFVNGIPEQAIENPLFVPPIDREFLWQQLVDVVDNYFKIEREDRVRSINGVLTEGRIDTRPTIGSTWLEPWRLDSTPGYEKAHATLQTIRRRSVIRVSPNEAGYLVDVTVHKELEDLSKPTHATAGGGAVRHDGTVVRIEGVGARGAMTLGWIPLGRDVTLEQRMLAEMKGRLCTVTPVERLPAGPAEGAEDLGAPQENGIPPRTGM
jgi:hypothetical protein